MLRRNIPEILSQRILAGIILAGRLGVWTPACHWTRHQAKGREPLKIQQQSEALHSVKQCSILVARTAVLFKQRLCLRILLNTTLWLAYVLNLWSLML